MSIHPLGLFGNQKKEKKIVESFSADFFLKKTAYGRVALQPRQL